MPLAGLVLAPWSVLAGGRLRSDAEEERRRQAGEKGRTLMRPDWERTEDEKKMSRALEKVANEMARIQGKQKGEVAIAYVMQKTHYVFPIIGGRKVEQLYQNLEGLKFALSEDQISYLENVLPFDPGFPTTVIVSPSLPVANMCELKADECEWLCRGMEQSRTSFSAVLRSSTRIHRSRQSVRLRSETPTVQNCCLYR